jgi:hypothetical protein
VIDWLAFFEVLVAALVGASVVVSLYALGLRMLAVAGRIPFVPPREFDEAITVLSPKRMKKELKKVRKARERNPHRPVVQRAALVAAYALFTVSGLLALFGIYLIVPYFH